MNISIDSLLTPLIESMVPVSPGSDSPNDETLVLVGLRLRRESNLLGIVLKRNICKVFPLCLIEVRFGDRDLNLERRELRLSFPYQVLVAT